MGRRHDGVTNQEEEGVDLSVRSEKLKSPTPSDFQTQELKKVVVRTEKVKSPTPSDFQTQELKKVVEMMEKFTANLNQTTSPGHVDESPKQDTKQVLEAELKQEKLKFESELQALKTTLHREIEQERALLRQDRETFEQFVVCVYTWTFLMIIIEGK